MKHQTPISQFSPEMRISYPLEELSIFENKNIKGFADSRRRLRKSAILLYKSSFLIR